MTELERSLAALAAEIDWPPTPELRLRLEPRARRRPLPLLAVALALLVIALGIAFAVPQARSAILRFFHLGGVTVERVERLPPAREQPLAATLGRPATAAEIERDLGFAMLLPPTHGHPRLYEGQGSASVVLAAPEPVLLSEFNFGAGAGILKKFASGETKVEWVQVSERDPGLWIAGRRHVVIGPNAPPRLAGNVLIWQHGNVTLRLEGRKLTKEHALQLARQITP